MIKNLLKEYIYPISVFAGGMIGVGFLSLPYIAMKTGILIMLAYFVVLTALTVLINSIFAEISLKTPDFKRFPGFVGYYLGQKAKILAFISVIIGTFGVLLVYLIVGGNFLFSALNLSFGGNLLFYALVYFVVAGIIVYFDIKVFLKVEFWVLAFLLISLLLIFINGFSYLEVKNLFNFDSKNIWQNIFLPYGALLFSLWGVGLMPETEEMMQGKKKNFKKVIIISTIIVSVFYFLFTIIILEITGPKTTETALAGLNKFLGNKIAIITLLSGALATFTGFVAQGIILKKVLMYDLKIKHGQAFIITCFTPLILFLLGLNSFIFLISFVGGILLSIDGILILLIYKKIGGKNLIIYPLSVIFVFAIIYQLIYFIK